MTSQWRAGWRKSSYSASGNGCVEVDFTSSSTEVRDTKQRGNGPVLSFLHAEWDSFVDALVDGGEPNTGAVQTSTHAHTEQYLAESVHTVWHLSDGIATLHFTEEERAAFVAGAVAGEFGTRSALAGALPAS